MACLAKLSDVSTKGEAGQLCPAAPALGPSRLAVPRRCLASSCLSNPSSRALGRPWPGTAQHAGLSGQILLIHSLRSAGQVLICPLSREGNRGQTHLLPRWSSHFSFSFLRSEFTYCSFTFQKDPQHFPTKAHVQLFDERQRTGNKQPRRRENKMSSLQDI